MAIHNNYKPDFSGIFLYYGFYDDKVNRTVTLAVAGYGNPQDAASEIGITGHQAEYLWNHLKRRNALYGGENYAALLKWADVGVLQTFKGGGLSEIPSEVREFMAEKLRRGWVTKAVQKQVITHFGLLVPETFICC
jgi:hypothetical protein